MSEMIEIVDSLEDKIGALLQRLKQEQQRNLELEAELTTSKNLNLKLEESLEQWKEKYESLKLAKSMVGSTKNTTEAKLKINALIRELDQCIVQLSE